MKTDILIIGAGAAGLMAMQHLLHTGHSVCLLEATAVAGGRMATLREPGFNGPVETGAEFVHGKLPLTLSLLDKAGIEYTPVGGSMIAVEQGKWQTNESHDPRWGAMMRLLSQLKTDTTIAHFLEQYFSGEKYSELRSSVEHFSSGFDLTDINKASALAALHEWSDEQETQYRVNNGYGALVKYLLEKCSQSQGAIHYNSAVEIIEYNQEQVTVLTADKRSFSARSLLITTSAGFLQSGGFTFSPPLDKSYAGAIAQLGFGDVIKILLQFRQPFWNADQGDIGFLLSDEVIPTWWTQAPNENNLLTGWLGGPPATAAATTNDSALMQMALQSLANIFYTNTNDLQQLLQHHNICRWQQHPFAKGGYSYVTVQSAAAKKILSHPVAGMIFFAGEALYRGQSQGTVEAALQSGLQAAKLIAEKFN